MRRFTNIIFVIGLAAALSGCFHLVVNREVEEHHYHGEPADEGRATTRVVTVEESTSFGVGTPEEILDQL